MEARQWYRDSTRTIRYAPWKRYATQTLDQLPAKAVSGKRPRYSRYGGDARHQLGATGFFRTQRDGQRWWIVDPSGAAYLTVAINSVRPGKSPNNQKAFAATFGNAANWADAVADLLEDNHFNGTGSWSELDPIRAYNAQAPKEPIVYCTQLNFLTTFAQVKNRRQVNILAWVFEPDFPTFCSTHAAKITSTYRNDPNLLGHFSDNELPFSAKNVVEIWETTQSDDAAHRAIADFLQEKGVSNPKALSQADSEDFLGKITALYYQHVSKALKLHDPNHLYLGSRLHASAKNVAAVFRQGVEPYVDVVSINYYGYWQPSAKHLTEWAKWTTKPFFITEFYTKGDDVGMKNESGAGWLVRTQADRGNHYQNFCLQLLKNPQCVGWHWFRYQDNDPNDTSADPSNQDSNKGVVNTAYAVYAPLAEKMRALNRQKYRLVHFFDATLPKH